MANGPNQARLPSLASSVSESQTRQQPTTHLRKVPHTGSSLIGFDTRLQIRYDRMIKEARGKGLLLGIEFPNTEIGYKVVSGLFKRNVLVAGTLTNSRVVRFEPALNIADPLLDKILERLEDTLKEIDRTTDKIEPEED